MTPGREPTDGEVRQWRARGSAIAEKVRALNHAGTCYQCEDRASGGGVLGAQCVIADDNELRVVLALDPRTPGHTIVVWKRHAHDVTELDDDETARLFVACRDVARAIRNALSGVERVCQVTMCDGPINHLHIQLIPRYAGTDIGSARLVDPRGPLLDGPDIAAAIADAYRHVRAAR